MTAQWRNRRGSLSLRRYLLFDRHYSSLYLKEWPIRILAMARVWGEMEGGGSGLSAILKFQYVNGYLCA